MTSYIGIRNVPGYMPDDEPVIFDTAQSAWASHLHDRKLYEEEQHGYSELPHYTDVVRLLAMLAEQPIGTAGEPPAFDDAEQALGGDGQVVGYGLTTVDGVTTGVITVRTSLPRHSDYDTDLGEVYEVREGEIQ